jgi:hypothetical protein
LAEESGRVIVAGEKGGLGRDLLIEVADSRPGRDPFPPPSPIAGIAGGRSDRKEAAGVAAVNSAAGLPEEGEERERPAVGWV